MIDDATAPLGEPESDADEKIWADLAKDDDASPAEDEPLVPATVDELSSVLSDDPETTTEVDAVPGDVADPWVDAPENLRTAHQAVLTERDEALHKERRMARTIPGQTRKVNELVRENKRLASELETAQAETPVAASAEDPELITAREEYPEVVGPLEKSNEATRTEFRKFREDTAERFARLEEEKVKDADRHQAALIGEGHPGWEELSVSPEFIAWGQEQPQMIQAVIEDSHDATEVSYVLSLYKQARAEPNPAADPDAERRRLQLDSSNTPRSKPLVPVTTAEDESDDGIWNRLKEQDRRDAART